MQSFQQWWRALVVQAFQETQEARAVILYPAPRWFREAVQAWLDDTPPHLRRHRVDVLFTKLLRAQPPELRVVPREDVKA